MRAEDFRREQVFDRVHADLLDTWAALGLAIFTTVITFIFHNFWTFEGAQLVQQQQAFFKNFAAVGGLLLVMAFGPGGWSLDARRHLDRVSGNGGQLPRST